MKLLISTIRRTGISNITCYCFRRGIASEGRHWKPAHEPVNHAAILQTSGPARTRFAPSPTGYLHLGSLRTALFNYLVAKATGGQFLLRIEDTDQSRTVPDAEARLYEDLEWAGLEWDEGPKKGGPCGPYKQSERTAIYREHSDRLLESGHAYRCFCSPERLRDLAELRTKEGLHTAYDRKCTHIKKGESDEKAAKGDAFVIRLKAEDRYPKFRDLVHGKVNKDMNKRSEVLFEDSILMKTDGFPTYHLANVVDDHLMDITHVIRGSEWLNSTPMHIALYDAFGWSPPQFAHISLLVDENRQKLSKRVESMNIRTLREQGVLPETLINYAALLGWSHNELSDVMTQQDLIAKASLKYTRGDTMVKSQKLWYLQKRHAVRYLGETESPPRPLPELTDLIINPIMKILDASPEEYTGYHAISEVERQRKLVTGLVRSVVSNLQYTSPQDFIDRNPYFFKRPTTEHLISTIPRLTLHEVPPILLKELRREKVVEILQSFEKIQNKDWNLTKLKEWRDNSISECAKVSILQLAEKDRTKDWEAHVHKAWGRLINIVVRWAILGGAKGPDGADSMRLLGKEESVKRLETASEILTDMIENEAFGSLDG